MRSPIDQLTGAEHAQREPWRPASPRFEPAYFEPDRGPWREHLNSMLFAKSAWL
jgi:hypothetical protein